MSATTGSCLTCQDCFGLTRCCLSSIQHWMDDLFGVGFGKAAADYLKILQESDAPARRVLPGARGFLDSVPNPSGPPHTGLLESPSFDAQECSRRGADVEPQLGQPSCLPHPSVLWRNEAKLCERPTWQRISRLPVRQWRISPLAANTVGSRSLGSHRRPESYLGELCGAIVHSFFPLSATPRKDFRRGSIRIFASNGIAKRGADGE